MRLKMVAWNVYSKSAKRSDTVYYQEDCDAEYVKRAMIDHDGWPSDTQVRRRDKVKQ